MVLQFFNQNKCSLVKHSFKNKIWEVVYIYVIFKL